MPCSQEYTKYFDEFENRKKLLQAAEQLFDNPLADFSNFNRARTDFSYMEQIYKIYKAQKYAREIWSKTLWTNLNPQALVDGIEQFFKEFRWGFFLKYIYLDTNLCYCCILKRKSRL